MSIYLIGEQPTSAYNILYYTVLLTIANRILSLRYIEISSNLSWYSDIVNKS